jgi:hypothetical protein
MGDNVSASGESSESVYTLLALLAGDGYSREQALDHTRVLIDLSRSPHISKDVKRAIGFVQSFTFSLANLNSEQMGNLILAVSKRKEEIAGEG